MAKPCWGPADEVALLFSISMRTLGVGDLGYTHCDNVTTQSAEVGHKVNNHIVELLYLSPLTDVYGVSLYLYFIHISLFSMRTSVLSVTSLLFHRMHQTHLFLNSADTRYLHEMKIKNYFNLYLAANACLVSYIIPSKSALFDWHMCKLYNCQ